MKDELFAAVALRKSSHSPWTHKKTVIENSEEGKSSKWVTGWLEATLILYLRGKRSRESVRVSEQEDSSICSFILQVLTMVGAGPRRQEINSDL